MFTSLLVNMRLFFYKYKEHLIQMSTNKEKIEELRQKIKENEYTYKDLYELEILTKRNNYEVKEELIDQKAFISYLISNSVKNNDIEQLKYIHKYDKSEFVKYFTYLDYNYLELIDKVDIIRYLSEKFSEVVFQKLDYYFTVICKNSNVNPEDLVKFLVAFPKRYSYLFDINMKKIKYYNIDGDIN